MEFSLDHRPPEAVLETSRRSARRPSHIVNSPMVCGTALAALLCGTGCNPQATSLLYQAAGTTGRTVVDLVLTDYANVVAIGLDVLRTLLTGS